MARLEAPPIKHLNQQDLRRQRRRRAGAAVGLALLLVLCLAALSCTRGPGMHREAFARPADAVGVVAVPAAPADASLTKESSPRTEGPSGEPYVMRLPTSLVNAGMGILALGGTSLAILLVTRTGTPHRPSYRRHHHALH